MIDYDSQLKLQAYLDGELPPPQVAHITDQLSRDPEAAALLLELRNTGQALSGFELEIRHPESREFFWSKIQREIARAEHQKEDIQTASWLTRLQRLLVPGSAVALLALVLTVTIGHSAVSQPGEMELVSEDMSALTFRSQSERMTMVWLYPRSDSARADEASPIDFEQE